MFCLLWSTILKVKMMYAEVHSQHILMSDFDFGKICQKISGIFLKNHLHPRVQ
jgi:hypothetical protein